MGARGRSTFLIRHPFRHAANWFRRWPLLPAVLLILTVSASVAIAAWILLGRYLFQHRWPWKVPQGEINNLDLTKLALTVAGGIGAVVALTVAYRRQRDVEQGRFVERFGTAAKQLGDPAVAVRIAGVYAMAGVADESRRLRRQQCVDVLCGYLRLPYDPESGANHQTKLVLKHHRGTTDGTQADDQEQHLEFRQNDRQVRQTIVYVIATHLQRDAETSWSRCNFDFRGAVLEAANMREAWFRGRTRFGGVTFRGKTTSFIEATFSGTTSFVDATFCGENTLFSRATFRGKDTSFSGATFSGTVQFIGADFGSAQVSFASPRQWGPPPPEFDWGNDGVGKPVNVEPRAWPPVATSPE